MSYGAIQNRLLGEDRLATIIVKAVTPLRLGGYNAKPYSEELELMEKPRTQSLKGVWRWWARALVAGALLSAGKRNINLADANEKLSSLLGSTDSASKLYLRIVDIEEEEIIEGRSLQRIPRINLLMLRRGERRLERYYRKITFKIELVKRPGATIYVEEERFGLASLILALTLGGLGSIQSRGFGRFKVLLDSESRGRNPELGEALDRIYKSKDLRELTDALKGMVKLAFIYTQKFLRVKTSIKPKESLIPAIVPDAPHIFRLEAVKFYEDDPIRALIHIGNATLKMNWKKYRSAPDKNVHTWILGLPRRGAKAGYFIDSDPGRRLSAIGFSLLKLEDRYAVVMYGFKSTDLARLLSRLVHISLPRHGKPQHTKVLEDAYRNGVWAPRYKIYRRRVGSPEELLDVAFDVAWEALKRSLRSQR